METKLYKIYCMFKGCIRVRNQCDLAYYLLWVDTRYRGREHEINIAETEILQLAVSNNVQVLRINTNWIG